MGSPVPTQRRFNVYTTSPQRYGRCIDVKTEYVLVTDLLQKNKPRFVIKEFDF